jgi:hypothetical protein
VEIREHHRTHLLNRMIYHFAVVKAQGNIRDADVPRDDDVRIADSDHRPDRRDRLRGRLMRWFSTRARRLFCLGRFGGHFGPDSY